MEQSEIVVKVAESFEVTLYSHAGTGYTWALVELSQGVALTDVSSSQVVPMPGGAVRTVFTFIGTRSGKGSLAFSLLRSWEPSQPADERKYTVSVTASNVEQAMKAAAGNEHFPPVVFTECSGEHEGKAVLSSSSNCMLKYGIQPHEGDCHLKYGFPVTPMYNVNPPIARYMAQPPRK